jgi:hypothetical protein
VADYVARSVFKGSLRLGLKALNIPHIRGFVTSEDSHTGSLYALDDGSAEKNIVAY